MISIADEGIGIAPEDRERIFEPFRRTARGAAVQIPGVGLGLSVSRRLVEAHSGRIEVEARREGGSIFRVRLPVADEADLTTGGRLHNASAERHGSPP